MIRKFEQKDLDSVMQIWLQTNLQAHSFIPASYWYSNFELVKNILPEADILLAVNQKDVIGFIGRNQNEIAGIFVSDQLQSKGIGTRLLAEAKKSCMELTLHVYQKNEKAVSFYLREGFSIDSSEIEEATGEREHKMIWRKENLFFDQCQEVPRL